MELNRKNARKVNRIAVVTGRSVAAIANEALDRWFEKEGSVVLDKISEMETARTTVTPANVITLTEAVRARACRALASRRPGRSY